VRQIPDSDINCRTRAEHPGTKQITFTVTVPLPGTGISAYAWRCGPRGVGGVLVVEEHHLMHHRQRQLTTACTGASNTMLLFNYLALIGLAPAAHVFLRQ